MSNSYLAQYGVNAVVTGISVDAGEDTVLVQVLGEYGAAVSERGAGGNCY
jgi:hypothetical protein